MTLSRLLKHLKKQLRRKKLIWLSLGVWFAVLSFTGAAVYYSNDHGDGRSMGTAKAVYSPMPDFRQREEFIRYLSENDVNKQVILNKIYVCGEQSQRLGIMDNSQILSLLEQHPDWHFDWKQREDIAVYEFVNELSPECQDAFMGIDTDGNLTLFEGPPEKDNAIRTFFQLDVRHLKTSLPAEVVAQLYQGIPIHDLAQYHSVISTFSDYAINETTKVMKPQ